MDHTSAPAGLDTGEADRLLGECKTVADLHRRMEALSRALIGRPYLADTLIGGVSRPEALTIRLDGFDCVTYMETVLALALSTSVADFIAALRGIRYEGGRVEWRHRNHYMTDWARNNVESGLLSDQTRGDETVTETRLLDAVGDLPKKEATFTYFPAGRACEVEVMLETGDLVYFVSTKPGLDAFHTGLIVREGGGTALRHASRTAGAVVEQPLDQFIGSHSMAGFVLLRPVEQKRNR